MRRLARPIVPCIATSATTCSRFTGRVRPRGTGTVAAAMVPPGSAGPLAAAFAATRGGSHVAAPHCTAEARVKVCLAHAGRVQLVLLPHHFDFPRRTRTTVQALQRRLDLGRVLLPAVVVTVDKPLPAGEAGRGDRLICGRSCTGAVVPLSFHRDTLRGWVNRDGSSATAHQHRCGGQLPVCHCGQRGGGRRRDEPGGIAERRFCKAGSREIDC